jgi:hypothetical protein
MSAEDQADVEEADVALRVTERRIFYARFTV